MPPLWIRVRSRSVRRILKLPSLSLPLRNLIDWLPCLAFYSTLHCRNLVRRVPEALGARFPRSQRGRVGNGAGQQRMHLWLGVAQYHPRRWELAPRRGTRLLAVLLGRPEFVGAKLAPPHTCLPMFGDRIEDVVKAVAASSTPILGPSMWGRRPFVGLWVT